jgi:hypothetical protein
VLSDLIRGEVIGLQKDRTEDSLRTLLNDRRDARQRAAVQASGATGRSPPTRTVRPVSGCVQTPDLAIESADWLHSSLGDFSLSKQSMESWQDRRLAVCQTGTCRDGDGSKTSEQANPFG